ncbi:MAG: hypothetical protein JO243_11870 [Solirubrobacterales bacterium]|nr:hypothetical protein [Solirubrobacterales bacterium]
MNTGVGRYALGVAALALICGSLAIAAVAIRRRALADWTGPPARLAETVIGLALLVAMLELLGAVGLFELGPVLVACVLTCAGVVWATPPASRPRRPRSSAIGAGVVIALLGAATVLAEWGALTIQSYDVGIRGFDSLWYHLPWAASFAQTGHITPLRFTDVEYLTPFYPATAELLHGLGIVLLGRDTLSPGLNLVWLGLTLLAAYCIGRRRGVGAATLLGAALAMATTMMDYSQAGSAANDVIAVFFLLAAVALIANDPCRTAALVLAAVAAGLAVGTKLTVVAPVLALTVGVIVIAPRIRQLATAGLWLGPLILAGGFWYARNLIAVGNPVPWSSLGGLLPTPAPALQQHTGYSVAHYLGSSGFWSRFAQPALAAGLGRWWYLILAAAIIGPLLCLAWPGADRITRMLGGVALLSLAAYLVTPETAAGPMGGPVGFAFNLRYLAPALTLALVVAPVAPPLSRAPRARAAAVLAFAVILIGTVAQPRLWPSAHALGAIAIGAAFLAGIAVLVARRPRRASLAVLAAAALVLVAAGYRLQTHYLRGRYAYQPGVSYLAPVWALFRNIHHARVGIVGTFGGFFSYPLYGLDLSNHVEYVAERGPHGSFTPIATCARWRAQLNTDHLKYIITTPARDPWHPRNLQPSPEDRWTASDPGARPVFRELATGQPIVVYRIHGPLHPMSCG